MTSTQLRCPGDVGAALTRVGHLPDQAPLIRLQYHEDEPLARGMAAALPYCDEFVDDHSLTSLTSLVSLAALLRGDSRPAVINAGAPR